MQNKPANWPMAYANPSRNAQVSFGSEHVLDRNYKFQPYWSRSLEIQTGEGFPSPLVVDGYILVPNASQQAIEVLDIATGHTMDTDGFSLTLPLGQQLTRICTPVCHGVDLYYHRHFSIMRTSLLHGDTEEVASGDNFAPANGYPTPLALIWPSKGTTCNLIAFPLANSFLLVNTTNGRTRQVNYTLPPSDVLRNPVALDGCIIATTREGRIVQVSPQSKKAWIIDTDGYRLSAPVVSGSVVYFEAVHQNSHRRYVGWYAPRKARRGYYPIDNERVRDLSEYEALLVQPPLSDVHRIRFTDLFGTVIYTYHSGVVTNQPLPPELHGQVNVGHALSSQGFIYAASRNRILKIDLKTGNSNDLMLVRDPGEQIQPVIPPIRYADRLIQLCTDRVICIACG